MKRIITLLAALLTLATAAEAQIKRPTIMVVPSDVWCNTNGYMIEVENHGYTQRTPDYRRALQSDATLVAAIARINMLMADRGFPLKNLESVLKSIERNQAEAMVLQSKSSGASLAESPLDMLRRTAKADIIMQLTWTVNEFGPKKSITYILQGIDAYTDMQIAGSQGTGAHSFSTEVPILLEEAVSTHMDNFTDQLQAYFDDLQEFGRLVTIDIRVFDNGSGIDLESMFGGLELAEIIDNWMADNTVGHRFGKGSGSANFASYEQVRIPLYRTDGAGMDAESFARMLRKYLAAEPYNITTKIIPRGLGGALIVVGEK